VFVVAPLMGGVLITVFGVSMTFLAIGLVVATIGALGIVLQSFIWGPRQEGVTDWKVST
jgi:heme O synthase-like polyprenyltransferase